MAARDRGANTRGLGASGASISSLTGIPGADSMLRSGRRRDSRLSDPVVPAAFSSLAITALTTSDAVSGSDTSDPCGSGSAYGSSACLAATDSRCTGMVQLWAGLELSSSTGVSVDPATASAADEAPAGTTTDESCVSITGAAARSSRSPSCCLSRRGWRLLRSISSVGRATWAINASTSSLARCAGIASLSLARVGRSARGSRGGRGSRGSRSVRGSRAGRPSD